MIREINMAVLVCAAAMLTANFAAAQNKCSKETDGGSVQLHIRNASSSAISVNFVDDKCKESSSGKIEPGKKADFDTVNGHVFRVRDGGNKVISEITASSSDQEVTIGIVKNSDPRQSFIQTLNQIRRGRNLPEIELNDQLTQGCQWFADLMAKFDKGGHDAVEIGGKSYTEMQHPWLRSKKFGYAGDGGTEATSEGDTTDVSSIGGDRMIGWASSNTHYRPFLGMDGQMFKHVGFGWARSAKKPNYYYTCAVFGNPEEGGNTGADTGANTDAGGAKEPITSDVPEGLKFTEANFFQMKNGEEKNGTSFAKSGLDELQASFCFENPSGELFNVEVRSYLNGKVISSEPMKDLKGSGTMSVLVAGENGQFGKVTAGKYKFEVLLNGKAVLTAEAIVK